MVYVRHCRRFFLPCGSGSPACRAGAYTRMKPKIGLVFLKLDCITIQNVPVGRRNKNPLRPGCGPGTACRRLAPTPGVIIIGREKVNSIVNCREASEKGEEEEVDEDCIVVRRGWRRAIKSPHAMTTPCSVQYGRIPFCVEKTGCARKYWFCHLVPQVYYYYVFLI